MQFLVRDAFDTNVLAQSLLVCGYQVGLSHDGIKNVTTGLLTKEYSNGVAGGW